MFTGSTPRNLALDTSACAALPHARGCHSSGYPQDCSHNTDPLNIHWITRTKPIQWIFTGSLTRHRSSEYTLDCSRGTIPVNFHWILRASACHCTHRIVSRTRVSFQWTFTGSLSRHRSSEYTVEFRPSAQNFWKKIGSRGLKNFLSI
jgi:hypothetical protein